MTALTLQPGESWTDYMARWDAEEAEMPTVAPHQHDCLCLVCAPALHGEECDCPECLYERRDAAQWQEVAWAADRAVC